MKISIFKSQSAQRIIMFLSICVYFHLSASLVFAASKKQYAPEMNSENAIESIEQSSKITPRKFRLHLVKEPTSLDPQMAKSGASNYLLGNLYRNLFKYNEKDELVFDLADSCTQKKQTLTCTLKKDLKWSDGTPLTTNDFLETYKKILEPKNAVFKADLLFSIKNANEIYKGQKKMSTLGVKALKSNVLEFQLNPEQGDFRHRLTNLTIAPTKPDLSAYSGPYKLDRWIKGKKIQLTKNFFYHISNPQGPDVEFLFIEEDGIALSLYEKNELDFLRRLPTLYIEKYKGRTDFQWIPLLRMDYIGFAGTLKNKPDLRKTLTTSLNYPELQKIFFADTRPGCLGLPKNWFSTPPTCYEQNLTLVKAEKTERLQFVFSAAGGDDHRRATEWLQDQWKKNANILVQLDSKEQKAFLELLEQNPPDIFRKGQPLDEPTCLNALQVFHSTSPDNVLKIADPKIDKWLQELKANPSIKTQKNICTMAFSHLTKTYSFIPLGAVQFASLLKANINGIKINSMNQLDLSELRITP